jgi:hypothetical protein
MKNPYKVGKKSKNLRSSYNEVVCLSFLIADYLGQSMEYDGIDSVDIFVYFCKTLYCTFSLVRGIMVVQNWKLLCPKWEIVISR